MIESLRLPLTFDVEGLRADLARVPDEAWVEHFNRDCYVGEWHAAALRGPAGATHPVLAISAPPGTTDWADTPVLAASPHLTAALARFRCPLLSVRLLRLGAEAEILEHRDHALGLEDGEVRLHVPVQTSDAVEFHLAGCVVPMREGELWYVNVNLPHRVVNGGDEPRVHLVVDCVVDDWLRGLFESAAAQ